MGQIKTVFDTNVIISALLWSGLPNDLLRLTENHHLQLFSSMEIIEEIHDVLTRSKFRKRLDELMTTPDELIESLLGVIEVVHPIVKLYVVEKDPDDNKIIECAVSATVDYIITGDPHLQRIKEFHGIKIVNPKQFMSYYNGRK